MPQVECREFCGEKIFSETNVILVYGAEGKMYNYTLECKS